MKTSLYIILPALAASLCLGQSNPKNDVMGKAYWDHWNPEVQAKIDRDIDQNRKASAVLQLTSAAAGADIKIEQISHDFVFGANIFNFNQLGTPERNRKYKELFGAFFNSATLAFYWKTLEVEPGKPRFKEEPRDTEEYWNNLTQQGEPKQEPHWRRPATDPVVEFCESKGIRIHGHPMIWGHQGHHPEWVYEQFCPADEKKNIEEAGGMKEAVLTMKPAEIEKIAPVYIKELKRLFDKRVTELAQYYGARVNSWDVVNESVKDYAGDCLTGDAVCASKYDRMMPGDYTYHAFKLAGALVPKPVLLNINEYQISEKYTAQIKDLLAKGCRVEIAGLQRHIFTLKEAGEIARGKQKSTPRQEIDAINLVASAGLPVHISEITIPGPENTAKGREIQAVLARNLYRVWFSAKPVMGITWWNVVDGCGAPKEPTTSGLFTRDMQPKPAFHALNKLINGEWKTNLSLKADETGKVQFRGFKGKYRVTWKDNSGREQQEEFYLKNDGDGNAAAGNSKAQ